MDKFDSDNSSGKPRSKSAQDLDDFQHEIAGRDVGRAQRFLTGDQSPKARQKREAQERERVSRLMRLLQSDPEYAALYNDTMDKLRTAETATEAALEDAEQRLAGAEEDLADMRDRASTLPDGTKVFRGRDGNVYTEDGRQLTDEERSQVEWKEGAPTYDEYRDRQRDAEKARSEIEELQRYQTDVLGHARDRMTDDDNPPSKDDLERFQQDIEDHAPKVVKDAFPEPDAVPAASIESTAMIAKPEI